MIQSTRQTLINSFFEQEADVKNSAWEVICCASEAHKQNVDAIEKMRVELQAKDAQLQQLAKTQAAAVTFADETTRLLPTIDGATTRKRGRVEDDEAIMETTTSAWDQFAALIRADNVSN